MAIERLKEFPHAKVEFSARVMSLAETQLAGSQRRKYSVPSLPARSAA